MDWCFSCIKKDTETQNQIETNNAKAISKKANSNCSSMIKNQKTNSNSIHNKSMSMFTFSKQNNNNKIDKGNVIFVDSTSQMSSITFDLSMSSSNSKMSSLRFCYDNEESRKEKLKAPKRKVIYKTK